MIQSARGGKTGRKRLLEKLGQPGTQPPPAELRRDQVNKEKTKIKKKEEATSPGTSSNTAGGETPLQKVGNKKRPKEPLPGSPMEEESSPDMVAVILGEAKERATKPRKQQPAATQPTERTAEQPPAKAKVPPPASARVSEELLRPRTEENRRLEQRLKWENWEKAAKKYITQRRQLQERRETNEPEGKVEDKMETGKEDKPTAENDQEANRQSQPLTPLIPRDESPTGDGSTTEDLEGEEEEHVRGKEPQRQQARVSESWHKTTRPAEPLMPKKRGLTGGEAQLRLNQLAYLTVWMQQSTERRQAWEREYPDQDEDAISLAKKMQQMDVQLGDGATIQCIQSQLIEWGMQVFVQTEPQEQTPETPQCRK